MNRIYKIVKNNSTGCMTAVSELAKGAKKGKTKLIALALLGGISLSVNAAGVSLETGYEPSNSTGKTTTVSGSNNILELNTSGGLSGAINVKGDEVVRNDVSVSLFDAYDKYKTGETIVGSITVTGNDNLDIHNLSNTTITEKSVSYKDPVTDAGFSIKAISQISTTTKIITDKYVTVDFYQKNENQYDNMELINVAKDADLTIVNNGAGSGNNELNIVAKNEAGVITVNEGAKLIIDTDINYYTGGDKSESKGYNTNDTYGNTITTGNIVTIEYKSFTSEVLGKDYSITNGSDLLSYSDELISYIQNNINSLGIKYNTNEDMQTFYNEQMALAYEKVVSNLTIKLTLNNDQVEQLVEESSDEIKTAFNNKVLANACDIGCDPTNNNKFITLEGDEASVTISEGVTLTNKVGDDVSNGYVIYADDSGENKEINVAGTINANGKTAIAANNTTITVGSSGKIIGNIVGGQYDTNDKLISNSGGDNVTVNIAKSGQLQGSIKSGDSLSVTNEGTISGSVRGGVSSSIENSGTITNSVKVSSNSSVKNESGGIINGSISYVNSSDNGIIVCNEGIIKDTVTIRGDESEFTNKKDAVVGKVYLYSEATANNEGYIVNTGQRVGIVNGGANLTNDGDIYIGYNQKKQATQPLASDISVENSSAYNGIEVTGNKSILNNNKNIYLSSSQHDVTLVSVSNKGTYRDSTDAIIELNHDDSDLKNTSWNKDLGNNNTAISVSGSGSTANINGTINLKDSGSKGLYAANGGQIELKGTINVESKNLTYTLDDEVPVRSFGAWIEGSGSTLTLSENATIKLDADSAIGVHVRSGAQLIINDDAGINFTDKENLIGFLVSGVSDKSSIIYNSDKELKLAGGEGSVIFRIERGSNFSSEIIEGDNGKILDSNNTAGSTLIVVTNGATAADVNNQTKADLDGFTLNVSGDGAAGVKVEGGADVKITGGTTIKLDGENVVLAKVDNNYYDLYGNPIDEQKGSSVLTSSANLTTGMNVNAQNSVGYYITNGGTLNHLGKILFVEKSINNIGVKIDYGGTLNSQSDSLIKVQGTAVEISGEESMVTIDNSESGDDPVVWAIGASGSTDDSAYHVMDGASLTLKGDGVTQAEGTAHGILIDNSPNYTGDKVGNIVLKDGAIIDVTNITQAGFSTGNGIENRIGSQNITFDNATINVEDGYGIHSAVGFSQSSATSGTINVYGSGTGIRFEKINSDGTSAGSTTDAIENTGYENVVINVKGADGKGIYVDSTKDVTTSTSVNIYAEDGGSALIIAETTGDKSINKEITQKGNLYSASSTSDGDIVKIETNNISSFTNNGELIFKNVTTSGDSPTFTDDISRLDAKNLYALRLGDDNKGIEFTNTGSINGVVELLGFDSATNKGNTVTLDEYSYGNVFKTGEGDDTFVINKIDGKDTDNGGEGVNQFTQLNGGDGFDSTEFTAGSVFEITKDTTLVDIDYIKLSGASQVTLNNINTAKGLNTGTQTYDISDEDSQLTYLWRGNNTEFDREILGEGTFKVDFTTLDNYTGKPVYTFAFDKDTNSDGNFEGTLELTNVNYTLADSDNNSNTSSLTNATLKASSGSYIKVGEGEQEIGGLTFNGGTVDFGYIDYVDHDKSTNHIMLSGTLDLDGDGGYVQITNHDEFITGFNPYIPTATNLLDHGALDSFVKLVSFKDDVDIKGSSANLTLINHEGKEIDLGDEAVSTHFIQDEAEVARATYNVRLNTGEDKDGLYVGYGLTKIELLVKNDKGNALIIDATDSNSKELDAHITNYKHDDGAYSHGDIQIQGTDHAVIFSDTNNDYYGATHVTQGASLVAGSSGVLGNTYKLHLDNNGSFDLNNNEQTIGSLIAHTDGSTVNLSDGTLTISGNDYTEAGTNVDADGNLVSYIGGNTLIGSGKLVFGDALLTRATTASPVTNIDGDNSTLSATVTNALNSTIYMNSDGGLGIGALTNNGELNIILNDEDGSLTNSELTGYGTVNKLGTGTLKFAEKESLFAGTINVNSGAMIFDGTNNTTYDASNVNIDKGTAVYAINNASFAYDVSNSGAFYVGNTRGTDSINTTVTIKGDYVGEAGSSLYFSGALADDDSPINVLHIEGTSDGTSEVYVKNIGGLGAKTIKGIEIITVADKSDAEFTQSKNNRIIAGAYDYKLQRSELNTNNWVLVSEETARPEIGSYIANLFAANNMFNLRLHDRLGETQYTDYLTGEEKVTSMWMRHQFGFNKYQMAKGDLSSKDSWRITQLGGDIAQWSSDELNRLHLGLMAGHGRSTTKTKSTITGRKADGTLDGYSYGAYATWYDNNEDKTGLHIDTWALWNNFKASISGDGVASEKYRLKGLTASVEVGYSMQNGTWGNYDIWLQPKGQVIWGNVKGKDRVESNGTHVSTDHGNLQTRLGFRASLLSNAQMQAQTNTTGQMFIEANWLHNSKLYEVTINDEVKFGQDGAKNIGELKVGVEGNISKNHDVWFNLAGQKGDHSYKNASIMLGYKYSF